MKKQLLPYTCERRRRRREDDARDDKVSKKKKRKTDSWRFSVYAILFL